MPIGIALLSKSKTLNWAYETEPQPNLGNRRLFWPRGKTLGGSSSINAMVYIRGHHEDYDAWGEEADPIWSFDNVLPLFKAMAANERFGRSEEHTSGLQSLMHRSYAGFCLNKTHTNPTLN